MLGGVHVGCYELLAKDEIHSIAELKGRTVGVAIAGANPHVFLTAMAAHVGLDPRQDIRWVTRTDPSVKPLGLFAEGKIDAFLGGPPEPQELRARHVGHVIFNSTVDRPWSQYFCCMLVGNGDYVRKYPVATKRVLRAILKGADLCASEPERVAQRLVDRGFTARYDYNLDALSGILYGAGSNTIPRILSDIMLCACTKLASSSPARRRSLPTAPTGIFSTNSNTS